MKHEDLRVCFVGDSFVAGTNDAEYLGWCGRVAALARRRGYDLTAYNLGIRRDTSCDIAARWQAEVERRLPEYCKPHVVFSFGVNDVTMENGSLRVNAAQSLRCAREMLVVARERYSVLMVGPPPIADAAHNERTRELADGLARVAVEEGVPFLAVFEKLSADPAWMAEVSGSDGAHPGAAGYARLAALVDGWEHWWFREGPK